MIPGFITATNPTIGTPGIVWLWNADVVETVSAIVGIPGDPAALAVQLSGANTGRYVFAHAGTGQGAEGQLIAPDPNWSTSLYLYVTASGAMFSTRSKADLPAGAPSQLVTYTPNATPKWTAKRVP